VTYESFPAAYIVHMQYIIEILLAAAANSSYFVEWIPNN